MHNCRERGRERKGRGGDRVEVREGGWRKEEEGEGWGEI